MGILDDDIEKAMAYTGAGRTEGVPNPMVGVSVPAISGQAFDSLLRLDGEKPASVARGVKASGIGRDCSFGISMESINVSVPRAVHKP